MNNIIQYFSFKTFSSSASMLLGLFSAHAHADWVNLGNIGPTFTFYENFNLDKDVYKRQAENSQSDLPRLSKVMADRGLCSRREADEWIANGWVKVEGLSLIHIWYRVTRRFNYGEMVFGTS